ncbi:MAG: hypothetical protein KKA42_12980 [candidate division Zixibacteria bacterium]|nr:hypothetical protein [candidate division Zixibacteria bacterium]
MQKRLLVLGLLGILLVFAASCSEDRDTRVCLTCPEIDPAYEAAIEFIQDSAVVMGLRPGVDELLAYDSEVDPRGWTHIRFRQHYNGVKVYGGEYIFHIDTSFTVTSHYGNLVPGIDINHSPRVRSTQALQYAMQHFDSLGHTGSLLQPGELVVFRWNGEDYLCWRYILQSDDGSELAEYFISADVLGMVEWRRLIIIDF